MDKASIMCTTSSCSYVKEELKIFVRFREWKLARWKFYRKIVLEKEILIYQAPTIC